MNMKAQLIIDIIKEHLSSKPNSLEALLLEVKPLSTHKNGPDFIINETNTSFKDIWLQERLEESNSLEFIEPILSEAWKDYFHFISENPTERFQTNRYAPIFIGVNAKEELELIFNKYKKEDEDLRSWVEVWGLKKNHNTQQKETAIEHSAYLKWQSLRMQTFASKDVAELDREVIKAMCEHALVFPSKEGEEWIKKYPLFKTDALWMTLPYLKNQNEENTKIHIQNMIDGGAQLNSEKGGENIFIYYAKWNPMGLKVLLTYIDLEENLFLKQDLIKPLICFSLKTEKNDIRKNLIEQMLSNNPIFEPVFLAKCLAILTSETTLSTTSETQIGMDMIEHIQKKYFNSKPLSEIFDAIGEHDFELKVLMSTCKKEIEKQENNEKNKNRSYDKVNKNSNFYINYGKNIIIDDNTLDPEAMENGGLIKILESIRINSPVLNTLKTLGMDFTFSPENGGGSAYHFLFSQSELPITKYTVAKIYPLLKELGVPWLRKNNAGEGILNLTHKELDLVVKDICLYVQEIDQKETEELLMKKLTPNKMEEKQNKPRNRF